MSQTTAAPPVVKPRFFFGWYIVGLSFLTSLIGTGIGTYTLGVFMLPMEQELGWSRTTISGVQSAGTLINALLIPFIGGVLDRRGGKALMIGGALLSGVGLIAVSLVQEVWQFYTVRAVLIGVGNVGMSGLVVNVAVANWFVRKRGRAIAFGSMGLSMAAVVLPPLCGWLIEAYGWRAAWIALGVLTWVTIIPATALFMRRRPEDMGLHPDGEAADSPAAAAQTAGARTDALRSRNARWTRQQAMRTSALWLIVGATSLTLMSNPAMLLHLVPFLQGVGFGAGEAAGGLAVIGVCGLLCKPLWGILMERFPVRYGAVAQMLISSSGVAAILLAGGTGRLEIVYLACFYFGIGVGGVQTVQETVWADYFGRLSLGAIRSIGLPFTTAASASGAVLGGLLYDLTGSYQSAFLVFVTALIVAAVLIGISRAPIPPTPAPEAQPNPA